MLKNSILCRYEPTRGEFLYILIFLRFSTAECFVGSEADSQWPYHNTNLTFIQEAILYILKFKLDSEVWENKAEEIKSRLRGE